VVDCVALPPAPEQVIEYVRLAVSAPVDCEPLVPSAPVHPPDAAHVLALAALQVMVALAPEASVAGAALSDTVGLCCAVIVAPEELLLELVEPLEPPELEELPEEPPELDEPLELVEPLEPDEPLEPEEPLDEEPPPDEPAMPEVSLPTADVLVAVLVVAVLVVGLVPAPDAVVVLAPAAVAS
jgi:hypothetical protein